MDSLSKDARTAGLLYVAMSIPAPFSLMYVPGKLIAPGNAAATANNILAHEGMFRAGIAASLVSTLIFVLLGLALYRLFSKVNRNYSTLLVTLVVISAAMAFVNEANNLLALNFFRGGSFVAIYDKVQREALGMMFLGLHNYVIVIEELFWGLWLLPFGVLVMKSEFLPRILGVLLIVNCFAYVVLSMVTILAPAYTAVAFRAAMPALLGELWMMLWLLFRGARPARISAAAA